jgi:acetyl-CoA carboxylase carboxyl transferase subunit beta
MRISARQRLEYFLDPGEQLEIGRDAIPIDRLNFKDSKRYVDRLLQARKSTGEESALIVVEGQLKAMPLIVAAFEFGFIGGSMGAAVGERFAQGAHRAIEKRVPFVCFTCSGGARMQEGLFSLLQMSKTSAVLARLAKEKLPYVVVLTDPTTGGVSASLAMLGDVIVAEPNALVGFAGPRVIKQTVQEELPEGFQRSEFLLKHGAIDRIIPRHALRDEIHHLLSMMMHQFKYHAA